MTDRDRRFNVYKVTLPTTDPMDPALLRTMSALGVVRAKVPGCHDAPFEEYVYACDKAGHLEVMIDEHWGPGDYEVVIEGRPDPTGAWAEVAKIHVRALVDGLRADGFAGTELKRVVLERARADYHEHLVDAFMAEVERAVDRELGS